MFEIPVLHPIFVHFPVALLPVAVVCDLLGRLTGRASLAHAGWWALLFATLAAPVTAATGWYWLWNMGDMDHAEMRVHQWLGTALPLLLILLAFWRYRIHMSNRRCSWPYLATLIAALIAVTVQGHLGGLMSFGEENQPAVGDTHDHMNMPMNGQKMQMHNNAADATQPTTGAAESSSGDDGWSDTIHVKEHHHG